MQDVTHRLSLPGREGARRRTHRRLRRETAAPVVGRSGNPEGFARRRDSQPRTDVNDGVHQRSSFRGTLLPCLVFGEHYISNPEVVHFSITITGTFTLSLTAVLKLGYTLPLPRSGCRRACGTPGAASGAAAPRTRPGGHRPEPRQPRPARTELPRTAWGDVSVEVRDLTLYERLAQCPGDAA
jgi:hypothetical protein